ncbi:unnamed protein product [Leptosia nina]|uniref:Uncharacterized protein n=1 Tax=Leptosia nina TaxID=320188 RepID=A0AAV1JTI3_9NEOP
MPLDRLPAVPTEPVIFQPRLEAPARRHPQRYDILLVADNLSNNCMKSSIKLSVDYSFTYEFLARPPSMCMNPQVSVKSFVRSDCLNFVLSCQG